MLLNFIKVKQHSHDPENKMDPFSQNTFYSGKTGVEVSSQRVTIQVEFSHVLRSISKGAFKIIYFPNYYGLKFD